MRLAPASGQAARRVVVTGAGMITALGTDRPSNAAGFRTGRRAFRPVTVFDVSRQRVRCAAEVDLPSALPPSHLPARRAARLDRAARLLIHAACEAWATAGWTITGDLPVVLGTTSGGMALGEAYYRAARATPLRQRGQASRVLHYQAQSQAIDVQAALGFSGPTLVIANACASGANAIGHAFHLLRTGRAERTLAGGYDALSHLVFAGFDALHALSPTQCRPFDAGRDGLALGEGAAVFALETLAAAEQRGARILAEIAGYGAATDIHHLTQPQPEGAGAVASMSAACAQANVAPEDVGYLNAHGTGTPLNDASEAAAINRWAGDHAPALAVSSTKAGIGHLLGAAGAVEFGVCVMALAGQWLPPMPDTIQPDPACAFRLVREPVAAEFEFALTNSFGFGGANASLLVRRWT